MCFTSCKFYCRGNVDDRFVDVEFWEKAHCGLHTGRIVTELDTGTDAVKERGGDGKEAVARPAVGNGSDVGVDPENLLHDDEAGEGFACGMGDIRTEQVPVGGTESYRISHEETSSGDLSIAAARRSDQTRVLSESRVWRANLRWVFQRFVL